MKSTLHTSLLPAILLLLWAGLGWSGEKSDCGSISGLILDATTRQPVAGAMVIVKGLQPVKGAACNQEGRFLISQVPAGVHQLSASAAGYSSLTLDSMTVEAGRCLELGVFHLQADPFGPDIVVKAQRNEIQLDRPLRRLERASEFIAFSGKPDGARRYPCMPPMSGNREEYSAPEENGFVRVSRQALSTFSVDVDVASYTNLRRYLEGGQLPPVDAMRVEEWLNFFPFEYPQPTEGEPFSLTTELSFAPWEPTHRLLLIGLQGRELALEQLPPCNLVFLVDVSGSMEAENKLPLVKSSLRLLVDQLRQEDRVAIVAYAGNAGLVLPSTPGSDKSTIRRAIEHLQAGGATAGQEGILLAYQVAREHFLDGGTNRIVWATDGDFNVGVSDTDELVRLVGQERKHGVSLSLLGFGMGNLKDHRLEQLADKGDGFYAYVDSFVEARRLLVGQMAGTLFTIARDVKLQIEFNPAEVRAYRLIGYENRLLDEEDFANDRKDAGDIGAGHRVTALYELIPAGAPLPGGEGELRYQEPRLTERAATGELATLQLRHKDPGARESRLSTRVIQSQALPLSQASANLRFASAVAELGLLLRDSPYQGDASFQLLRKRADQARDFDPDGYRAEFVRLVDVAQSLAKRD